MITQLGILSLIFLLTFGYENSFVSKFEITKHISILFVGYELKFNTLHICFQCLR
jgi:hypothetical protein